MMPFDGDAFFISAISLIFLSGDLLIAVLKSLGFSISLITDLSSASGVRDLADTSLSFFFATILSRIDM